MRLTKISLLIKKCIHLFPLISLFLIICLVPLPVLSSLPFVFLVLFLLPFDSGVSIGPTRAVRRRGHLSLNPGPEVRYPPIHTVLVGLKILESQGKK